MAVKKNEENVAVAEAPELAKKNNTLIAVALGVAGASLLLSAGSAFANTFDHRPDARGSYSVSEGQHGQGSQGQGMQAGQMGQHRERGEQGPHQNGQMRQGATGSTESGTSTTDVAPQGGMMQGGKMKFNATTGAS